MGQLGATHLRFAVTDCLRHPDPEKRRLGTILGCLWREAPDDVHSAYDAAILGSLDVPSEAGGRHGIFAARMRKMKRPLLSRDKIGLTVGKIAETNGIDRAVLVALMERHGYLELAPYGGRQSRRLVTDEAFHAGVGHNVDPGKARSSRLDGAARATPFPVFYPEAVPSLLWTLDWPGIQAAAKAIPNKRQRMRWLLEQHGYLPDKALEGLSGYSLRGVKKARAVAAATPCGSEEPSVREKAGRENRMYFSTWLITHRCTFRKKAAQARFSKAA